MRAIIPVAGVGSRLRPHTYTLPKVLLNVAGKPILGHILDTMIEEAVNEATFVVGYMGDLVEEYVRENYDLKATFVEQESREGLGHAIWLARESLRDEPVLIVLGDTIFDVDLKPVMTGEHSSLGVKHVEDPRRFGVIETRGQFVDQLVEKPENPTTNLAIVGLYFIKSSKLLGRCLDQLVHNNKRTRGEYQLTDALQMMIDKGERFTTFNVDRWFDCGKPETLLATNRHLLSRRPLERRISGAVVNSPVYIAPTATIGNAIIGPNATIADGAVVRDSIITNSIVGEHASVEKAILDESIIGADAKVRGEIRKVNIGASSELSIR
ncbi:MAG: NTP transferase domain-containing protein [Chlorobi bacterium]|nr:NTP transferase domain-containing protein [Chlorobiota bacterium]